MGLTANTTVLGAGGFNSYLYGQPDIHLFNVSVADKPRWIASADPPKVLARWCEGCHSVACSPSAGPWSCVEFDQPPVCSPSGGPRIGSSCYLSAPSRSTLPALTEKAHSLNASFPPLPPLASPPSPTRSWARLMEASTFPRWAGQTVAPPDASCAWAPVSSGTGAGATC